MSNTATGICRLMFTDVDGQVLNPKPIQTSIPYMLVLIGKLPIPAGTPANTEIDLPMLGITQDATYVCIQNESGQPLGVAYGGNWMPAIPDGGMYCKTSPAPITSN